MTTSRTIGQQVTTTAGEPFPLADVEVLAALIYKRFGWSREAAAAAYRRLLGNSCPDEDFQVLADGAIGSCESRQASGQEDSLTLFMLSRKA